MINCRRPSNKSSRLTLPRGPSNSYAFWTAIHGIRRRSAARASRERVKAFSFTRSPWRAASHSSSDTIGGVFIARRHFPYSSFLSLLVDILFLLYFLKRTETIRSDNFSELAEAHRQSSIDGLRRPLLLWLRCVPPDQPASFIGTRHPFVTPFLSSVE